MANSQATRVLSVISGAAVRIFRFVALDSTTGLASEVGTAQSVAPDGICAEAVSAANKCFPMIQMNGAIALVEAGAATTKGGLVASDNQGRAIDAVSGVGNWTAGKFLDAAAGAGEIVRILLALDRDQA